MAVANPARRGGEAGHRWDAQEDEALAAWYADGVTVLEIGRRLGRSPDAVDARRRSLGIASRRPRARTWSPLQDAILRGSAEAGIPARSVAERLGIPLEAVPRRRRELAPVAPARRRWTAQEDLALRRAMSAGEDVGELAGKLGRTEGALLARARSTGRLARGLRRRWSAAEDGVLRDGYEQGLPCTAIAEALGGTRTAGAVAARARKLGVVTYARLWAAADDAALARLATAGASVYAAARRQGRSMEAIRRRAHRLGITLRSEEAPASGRRWTEQEDRMLAMFSGLPPGHAGNLLGRSDAAVARRRRALGLSNRSPHHLPPAAMI